MNIDRLVVGPMAANCYLVWDEVMRKAIIIDPGGDAEYVINRLRDLNLNPSLIIATHGHIDHVMAVTELQLAFDIPFWIHKNDLFLIKNIKSSAKYWVKMEADIIPRVDKYIEDGEMICITSSKDGQDINNLFDLKVILTSGHTPGSVSLWSQSSKLIFTGDTLFRRGIGRSDFSYSSAQDLERSVRKLLCLPNKTVVYPGHGEETVIEEEKAGY